MLIDVDKMELSYSGLVYIDPTDSIAIARYFADQVRRQEKVKAVPAEFIRSLSVQPENAGDKSRVLSWLLRKWEEEEHYNFVPVWKKEEHAEGEDDSD